MSFPQMQQKREVLFEAAFILVVATASAVVFWHTGMANVFKKDTAQLRVEFLECFTEESQGQIFACMSGSVGRWVDEYDMAVGDELAYYQSLAGADRECHDVGHIIGEEFFSRYGVESLAKSSFACYASIQHGILGAFQTEFGSEAFIRRALESDLCNGVRDNAGSYALCVHGLGHTFLLSTEDFDYQKAADLCWQLDVPTEYLHRNCVSGVFMELFDGTIGDSHYTPPPELFTEKRDVFYPCTAPNIKERDRSACFSQVWGIVFQNPETQRTSRIGLCEEYVPKERWKLYCASSTGLSAAARNTSDTRYAISVCRDTENTTLTYACLAGALSYIIVDPVAPQENVTRFCQTLTEEEYGRVCRDRERGE